MVSSRGGRSFCGGLRNGMLSLRFWFGLLPYWGRLFWLLRSRKPWTFIVFEDRLKRMIVF